GCASWVPPAACPASGACSAPLCVIVICRSAAVASPPLSLMTCFMTVRRGAAGAAMSSLVMVQVLLSLAAIVPVQPLERLFAYPSAAASSTPYVTEVSVRNVTVVPVSLPPKLGGLGSPPVTVILQSAAVFTPP